MRNVFQKYPGAVFFGAGIASFLIVFGYDFFLKQNFQWDWIKELQYYVSIRNAFLRTEFPTVAFNAESFVIRHFYYLFYNPESAVFSLQTLLFLVTGDFFVGFQLSFFCFYLLGLLGFYRIARLYDLRLLAVFAGAQAFLLNGFFVGHITHGHGNWVSTAIAPLIVFFVLRATGREGRAAGRDLLYAAGLLGLLYYGGNQHNWLIFLAVCNLLLFTHAGRWPRLLFCAAALNAAAFLIIAPRLLPFLWLTGEYVSAHDQGLDATALRGLADPFWTEHESDFHVGVLYLVVFLFTIFTQLRRPAGARSRLLRFVLPAAALTAFALIPATEMIAWVPVLKSQGVRTRWFFGALLCLVLWQTFALSDWLKSPPAAAWQRAAPVVLGTLVFLNLAPLKQKFDLAYSRYWSRTEFRGLDHIIKEVRVPELVRDGNCVRMPTLAYARYAKSYRARCPLEDRGSRLAICCPAGLNADLKIEYTYYWEKRSLGLALLVLATLGALYYLFRFMPRREPS